MKHATVLTRPTIFFCSLKYGSMPSMSLFPMSLYSYIPFLPNACWVHHSSRLGHDISAMLRRTSESPLQHLGLCYRNRAARSFLARLTTESMSAALVHTVAQGWRPQEGLFFFGCSDPSTPIPVHRKWGESSSRPVFLTPGTAFSWPSPALSDAIAGPRFHMWKMDFIWTVFGLPSRHMGYLTYGINLLPLSSLQLNKSCISFTDIQIYKYSHTRVCA